MFRSPLISTAATAVLALLCGACAPDHSPSNASHEAAVSADEDSADALAGNAVGGADGEPASPAPDLEPGSAAPLPERVLDLETALSLGSLPLSCIDRPQALPRSRSTYLYDVTYTRRPGFEQDRAFYGCWDWHSAVNSTWTMVRLVKEFPDLSTAPLVREKLRSHITEGTIRGEMEFFARNRTFERPYGWAWLLLLHAELASWDDPEAETWSDRLEPLADLFADRLGAYLTELEEPSRSGAHTNTAFAIATTMQALEMAPRRGLERTLRDAAVRFYADDKGCAVADEPGRSDFLSPCLEEAALMARVMDPEDYVPWLDSLLPPIDSADFDPLRSPVMRDSVAARVPDGGDVLVNDSIRALLGRRSHLIGLAFTRAEAMLRVAAALPATDERVAVFRELAAIHVHTGFETMFDAEYAGSHWIGSFALKYLVEAVREDDL